MVVQATFRIAARHSAARLTAGRLPAAGPSPAHASIACPSAARLTASPVSAARPAAARLSAARPTAACLLAALFAACGDPVPPPAAPGGSVTVFFTRAETPVPVVRPVDEPAPDLEDALRELLRGPTEEERADGITSWFSRATAESLTSAEVRPEGRAVVDFRDLRSIIPGASSSTGSAMLLEELNWTVFQFPEVQLVEYRMEGSCELFWSWLQYECEIVPRPPG